MVADLAVNNLFVAIAGLLVFTMTPAVGLLEVGELGEKFSSVSLLKVMLITGIGFVVMAIIGFNTAFAPTIGGSDRGPLLWGRTFPRWLFSQRGWTPIRRLLVDDPSILWHRPDNWHLFPF
ncbi:MAG TPA: hypothetical protein VGR56_06835 [Nitrososphaerales archaeon]|nr:hypothetical protein [Nitrososphaerales archaeon]